MTISHMNHKENKCFQKDSRKLSQFFCNFQRTFWMLITRNIAVRMIIKLSPMFGGSIVPELLRSELGTYHLLYLFTKLPWHFIRKCSIWVAQLIHHLQTTLTVLGMSVPVVTLPTNQPFSIVSPTASHCRESLILQQLQICAIKHHKRRAVVHASNSTG